MPVTITFDMENIDANDRGRIYAAFQRLGWENLGGSAWRYPQLGAQNDSEDWFNHVVPALMYFRSIVQHSGANVPKFTIDAHSEGGYRGKAEPPVGAGILHGDDIVMYESSYEVLSHQRLRRFINDAADSL